MICALSPDFRVPLQFRERIEGAAPDNSAPAESEHRGAKEREGNNQHTGGEEQSKQGRRSREAAVGKNHAGDARVDEESRDRGPAARRDGGEGKQSLDQQTEDGEGCDDRVVAKDGIAILLAVADDSEPPLNPADTDQAGTDGNRGSIAGFLDKPSKGEIFGDFHAKTLEAGQLAQGFGPDHVESADTEKIAGFGIAHFPKAKTPAGQRGQDRPHRGAAHAAAYHHGRQHQVIGVFGEGMAESEFERLRRKEHIGIGEENPGSVCLTDAEVERVWLASQP